MKILFLSANPQGTTNLQLDTEAKKIENSLKLSRLRDQFTLVTKWAVDSATLRQAMLEEQPDIVHFSGHGEGQEGLVLVGQDGKPKPATAAALAGLFEVFRNVKCVLLNACYAEVQAKAIVRHIDYVIGMKQAMLDDAAIAFATGFYDGLGYGLSIEVAFKLGRNAIQFEVASFSSTKRQLIPVDLEEIEQAPLEDHLIPILLKRTGNAALQTENLSQKLQTTENISLEAASQQYRNRVREFLANDGLTAAKLFQLATLANVLKLSEHEANRILEEEENRIGLKSFEFETATLRVNERGIQIDRFKRQAQFFEERLGLQVKLEMVKIPEGLFLMGSPENELKRREDEELHLVEIRSFFMSKYPVTQEQWWRVAKLPQVNIELKPEPSRFKGKLRPVEQVSWWEAVEFCDRLSNKTGKRYRLPSEAEWEYACRAGTSTPFYCGETITTDLANYRGTDWKFFSTTYLGFYGQGSRGSYREQTIDVGSFPPNAFGLYDMHGNVWEWCADHWHEKYQGAPIDGSVWLSDNDNHSRLLRGGSWDYDPAYCWSACRFCHDPGYRNHNLGFRVVCVLA